MRARSRLTSTAKMLAARLGNLDRATTDDGMTKADVCASMETRLSLLVGKMVAAPTGASFAVSNNDSLSPPTPSGQKPCTTGDTGIGFDVRLQITLTVISCALSPDSAGPVVSRDWDRLKPALTTPSFAGCHWSIWSTWSNVRPSFNRFNFGQSFSCNVYSAGHSKTRLSDFSD
jgi:hypothetical protein